LKRRIFALLLVLALSVTASGCSGKDAAAETTKLSFLSTVDISAIEALNGKPVSIVGYMATVSPVSGKFMYLLNLPYQSCPFCVPNSTQLANTMAVYAPAGKTFDYTEQAIQVNGTMEVGDYTDEYGYVYNYRIVDASYEIVDLSTVSAQYALWMSIASDGVVGDLTKMFDYLYFVCQWTEYTSTMTGDDGATVTYYLYPGDADNYLKDDGPYGYAAYRASDYFDSLIARVNGISSTELTDLVQIIEDAHALEQYAVSELEAGNYTYDEFADKYTLNDSKNLADQFNALYLRYSQWLGKWEV
jgi:hypothetical protein